MTDDFDDDALRAAIGSRSGGSVDTGTARTAVITRAKRVRLLRTAAVGGTAVLVLVGGLLVIPNSRSTTGTPADRSEAPEPTTPTTIAAPSATTTVPATSLPTTTTTAGGPITTTLGSTVPTGAPVPSVTAAPVASTSTPTTSTPTTSMTPTTAPTTSTAPGTAPFTERYDSPGGSITVNWNGAALGLVSVDAAPGFQSEIEDQSTTRIRVRFRGDTDARIEVRVQDGRVTHTVS